jgi:hypothetical protein
MDLAHRPPRAIPRGAHTISRQHRFPILSASPLDTVKALWGGELPEFDSLDPVNELLRILVMGLWNRLSRHQERTARSRLVRVEIPETREGLVHI